MHLFSACEAVSYTHLDVYKSQNLDAKVAVDAIAEAGRFGINAFFAGTPVFAARRVVANDQCIRVEHDTLEARIRTHVFAHLFAHEAGKQIGEATVEENPEGFPGAETPGADIVDQLMDGREIADQCETCLLYTSRCV